MPTLLAQNISTQSVNVLVDNVNDSWIPCLRLLKSNGVTIFYTINEEREKSMNWNQKMADKVTQVQENYGDLVDGINLVSLSNHSDILTKSTWRCLNSWNQTTTDQYRWSKRIVQLGSCQPCRYCCSQV